MVTVADIEAWLRQWAPLELAESWDNVGLLVGNPASQVKRGMTCLTLSYQAADEAIEEGADLVVTHHPLPFRPLARITTETVYGGVLWRIIRSGISVYSAHTAYDSSLQGINQQWAERLGLIDVAPLLAKGPELAPAGTGRCGSLTSAIPLGDFVRKVKSVLALSHVQFSGDANQRVERVAIACGSGGSFWELARRADCQVLVTGDIGFHSAIEAASVGVATIAVGHFASERFAMEELAERLQDAFSQTIWWASRRETDPFQWL